MISGSIYERVLKDFKECLLQFLATQQFSLRVSPWGVIQEVCGQACYKAADGCPNPCSKKKGHAGAHTCGNH